MQIGKKIYTNSNKKAYRKPVLEVVEVDREIVLMAVTDPGGTPDTTAPSFNNYNTSDGALDQKSLPSEKNNPFGGGTPTYER